MPKKNNTEKVGKVSKKNRIRKSQILKLLLEEGMMSPSEISTNTELTLPMSSALMKELATDGYIMLQDQVGIKSDKNVGRPPASYIINPEGGFFFGIKVGLRKTRIILLDLQNNERYFHSEDTLGLKDSEAFLERLVKNLKKIIKTQNLPLEKIIGVGVAVPGLVDSSNGRSISYFNDLNMSLKDYLENKLKLNIEIENDVNAISLGELHFGGARNAKDVLCINLDKGIGMGAVINGELFTGTNGLAGELGHIRIDEQGKMCYCGKKGCLETFASGEALVEEMSTFMTNNTVPRVQNILSKLSKEELDLDAFVEIVLSGDQVAIEMTEKAGESIGKAIGILINLFNPQMIILGGKLSQIKEYILFPVKSSVIKHSLPESFAQANIIYTDIRRKAGCLGATTLVSRALFQPTNAAMQFV